MTQHQCGLQMQSHSGSLFSVTLVDSVVELFVEWKHEKSSWDCTQGAREGISKISNMCKISRKGMPDALAPLRCRREMKQMLISTLWDRFCGRGPIV